MIRQGSAGAVLPVWPAAPESTMGHHPDTVELHLFVPTEDGACESLLQEDDGETTSATEGARYRTTFTLTRLEDRVSLGLSVDGDGFPQFARTAFHIIVRGADPTVVRIEGHDSDASGNRIVLNNEGIPQVVSFDLRREPPRPGRA